MEDKDLEQAEGAAEQSVPQEETAPESVKAPVEEPRTPEEVNADREAPVEEVKEAGE